MCEYREEMFIGVGDIHQDGQNFKIFCRFEQTKMANFIRTKLHRIQGRIVVNACVWYREEMFIDVGDIHPDRQNFIQIFCQFEQTKMATSRPF